MSKRVFIISFLFLFGFLISFSSPTSVEAGCGCKPTPPGRIGDAGCNGGPSGALCYNEGPPTGTCPTGTWCTDSCSFDVAAGGIWRCGSGGGGGGGGGCSTSAPNAPTITGPTNGAVLQSNWFIGTWGNWGSWGEGCPNSRWNAVEVNYWCSTGWRRVWRGAPRNAIRINMPWGGNHCWRVVRGNNRQVRYSASRYVRTPAAPRVLSAGFTTASINQCPGSNITGRYSPDTNTNNPLTYTMDIQYNRGVANLTEARILFVSNSYFSGPRYQFAQIDGLLSSRTAGFRVTNPTGTPVYSAANNSTNPVFTGNRSSGNLTVANGTATLLDINGTGTRVDQIDANTLRFTWTIKVEDSFRNWGMGVYISSIGLAPDGTTQVSTYAAGNQNPVGWWNPGNLRYARMTNWRIDMSDPIARINGPVIYSPQNFYLDWWSWDAAAGSSGIRDVKSYCYLGGGTASTGEVTDLHATLGGTIPLSQTVKQYPDPSNCLVDRTSLGRRYYKIPLDQDVDIVYKMFAMDNACNESEVVAGLESPVPWISSSNSSVSANGGYRNFRPRNVELRGVVPEAEPNSAFLSEYGALAGTGDLPSERKSRTSIFSRNYSDRSVNPPIISGSSNWYDFIKETVSKKQAIQQKIAPLQISGSVRVALANAGVNVTGSKTVVEISTSGGAGTVTIGNDFAWQRNKAICDLNAVIFIDGNLVIKPHLIRTNTTGCVFIVKGDITVDKGFQTSSSTLPATAKSRYDIINGVFVTDGTFITTLDVPTAGVVRDGLFIKGAVAANLLELNRNLGLSNNPAQPAETVSYDPFYLENFRDLLSVNIVKLREK